MQKEIPHKLSSDDTSTAFSFCTFFFCKYLWVKLSKSRDATVFVWFCNVSWVDVGLKMVVWEPVEVQALGRLVVLQAEGQAWIFKYVGSRKELF